MGILQTAHGGTPRPPRPDHCTSGRVAVAPAAGVGDARGGRSRRAFPGGVAGLALTSGTIHVVAAAEHVGDDWPLGAFFAFVGAGQLVAAWRIYRRPDDERMLELVAAGGVIVSLLWMLSRTTGLAFGPEPGRASVGVADTITTLQQFILAAIVVALLRRPEAGDRRLAWMGGALATRLTTALLTTTLLLAALGGHEH